MSHELRAVIGPSAAIAPVAEVLRQRSVPLRDEWSLIPWTSKAFDSLSPSVEEGEVVGLHYAHSELVSVVRAASVVSAIAYVEIDCWAGQCQQGSAVFAAGEESWISEFGAIMPVSTKRQTPASEALQRIGVPTSGAADQFEYLALGRHRHTEDWE